MTHTTTAPSAFYIMGRTARTDWVELDRRETMDEARKLASEIMSKDSSVEIAIEERP